jgi:hypothetical protein
MFFHGAVFHLGVDHKDGRILAVVVVVELDVCNAVCRVVCGGSSVSVVVAVADPPSFASSSSLSVGCGCRR